MIQMPGTIVDGLLFTMPAGEQLELFLLLNINYKQHLVKYSSYIKRSSSDNVGYYCGVLNEKFQNVSCGYVMVSTSEHRKCS